MCRNGEFEDKISRLDYLSLTTLNVVDISQSGVLSQTGSGNNILKNISQFGSNVISQSGTGTNTLKDCIITGGLNVSSITCDTLVAGSVDTQGGFGNFGLLACANFRPKCITLTNSSSLIINRDAVVYELRFTGTTARTLNFAGTSWSVGDIIIFRRTASLFYTVNYSGVTIYHSDNSTASNIFGNSGTSGYSRAIIYLNNAFYTLFWN